LTSAANSLQSLNYLAACTRAVAVFDKGAGGGGEMYSPFFKSDTAINGALREWRHATGTAA
jgi:hypothetical protein